MVMKLHYFNFPGRVAAARALLDYSGIEYEFVGWTSDDFKQNIDKFPLAQLPVLEFDNGKQLCQSIAILQFAAQKAELIPTDDKECSFAFSSVYCLEDITSTLVSVINEQNEELRAQRMNEFQEIVLPSRAAKLEAYFKQFGSDGYSVGNSLSFVDFCVTAFKNSVDQGLFGETAKRAFNTDIFNSIENTCKAAYTNRAQKTKTAE